MGKSETKAADRKEHHSRHRKERSPENDRNTKSSRNREREDRVRGGESGERHRDRSRSPPMGQRPHREESDVKPRIKQERTDRGYERHGHERHEPIRVKQEQDTGVMSIKQEREMNDQRRLDRRQHQPQNPFQSTEPLMAEGGEIPKEKEKVNFETSGALTEDTNTYRGVVIKYNEPPEARKPKRKWRFYIFKGEQELPVLHVHRQSAYLLGRDRKIADIPIDHPSCSKQHAVLQYRLVDFTRDNGTKGRRVRPYVIDLESANGTFLNNKKIEPKRYYEIQEKDVVKFGFSRRDYVLLHANSKDDEDEL